MTNDETHAVSTSSQLTCRLHGAILLSDDEWRTPMTIGQPAITALALRLTRRIVALEGREESLQAELSAVRDEKTKVQKEFEALMGESTPATRPPNGAPNMDRTKPSAKPAKAKRGKKTEKGLGNTGWIHNVLAHMKLHPGQEFSPETLSQALGDPDRYSLTSTCLGRLTKGGLISRTGRGRFVFVEFKE